MDSADETMAMTPPGPATDADRLDERTRALKERIYAIFTGLAILGAVVVNGHATALEALLTVAFGVLGISVAGFLAEIVAHLVAHEQLPTSAEFRTIGRISAGALGSASSPLLVLALAWAGVLSLEWALWIGVALYAASLVAVLLLAARHSGLRPLQRILASTMLLGLAVLVLLVLLLAHLL